MKYYTIARIINRTYGQSDFGDEYHICPINAYHTNSKEFHPLFKTREKAEKYKNKLIISNYYYDNYIIVEMIVFEKFMKPKLKLIDNVKHIIYFLFVLVLWIRYSPDEISLINDESKCKRYGFYKYEKDNDKYPYYNIHRYFKYPFPIWLNKLYFKYYVIYD